jgi:UDP-N-acetylmuramoyl-L-alanyl-D-glutamate--2,6-diaminopimelate ligase
LTGRRARLSALLQGAGIESAFAVGPDPEICGAALDSRKIERGDLFFALPGLEADGVDFVPDAVRRGASAVVSSQPRPEWLESDVAWVRVDEPRRIAGLLAREYYGRPDLALTVVGITGTNGKTTVAHLVESIGSAAGRHTGRIGTVGFAFGEVERPSDRTTPEAPDFYRLLAEMRDESIDLVSMEVSSHALALHRVEGARFATAAFLNLGRDHLDFHGTEKAYFEAKARLFEVLDESQAAVVPADSDYGQRLRRITRARVLSFGRSASADVRLCDEYCGLDGSRAVLQTPQGSLPVRTFLLGRFNLDNVAAAAACALAVDLPMEAIASGVLALQVVPGRVEPVHRGQPFSVVVDFAHTEQALRNLLDWIGQLTKGRLIVVFGCGGDRDRGKRADMGRAAAESGAQLYLTSDNPRSEDPRQIMDQVHEGVRSVAGGAERCLLIDDRREAIEAAIGLAQPGDTVVIAGKGHETTQTVGKQVLPFDDRQVASEALDRLGWRERRRGA